MGLLLLNLVLGILWTLLTGDLHFTNFIQGVIIGYVILFVSKNAIVKTRYFTRLPKIFLFILYFIKELIVANIKVAYDILTVKDKMRPGIIALPLDAKTDLEITLFANLITMTPGSLSIDTSDDNKVLYVHAMYIDDPQKYKEELKTGLERKLLEILR
ncbi:MAG: Na+/H+ antiporter subunit E [Desulfobulbaceae bacterium]|nr:Na+/H+ antiporter subunit E [Candidatus Kapabacteria bacterium]MBS4000937.1 Na+/H+ antiporter subunit E [Desulfobulbaceae bacterium]